MQAMNPVLDPEVGFLSFFRSFFLSLAAAPHFGQVQTCSNMLELHAVAKHFVKILRFLAGWRAIVLGAGQSRPNDFSGYVAAFCNHSR